MTSYTKESLNYLKWCCSFNDSKLHNFWFTKKVMNDPLLGASQNSRCVNRPPGALGVPWDRPLGHPLWSVVPKPPGTTSLGAYLERCGANWGDAYDVPGPETPCYAMDFHREGPTRTSAGEAQIFQQSADFPTMGITDFGSILRIWLIWLTIDYCFSCVGRNSRNQQ